MTMTPEIRRLLDLHERMMYFATTRPSPQQTRQKSAREMVETFAYDLKDALAALLALLADLPPTEAWQPIETLHEPERELFFWVVPKTPEEAYCDTSGHSIFTKCEPYLHRGKSRTWSSLMKATHWRLLPPAPALPPPVEPPPLDKLHDDAMAIAYDDDDEWAVGYFTDGYKANLLANKIEELVKRYATPPAPQDERGR